MTQPNKTYFNGQTGQFETDSGLHIRSNKKGQPIQKRRRERKDDNKQMDYI